MWEIKTTDAFDNWFSSLHDADRAGVLAALMILREKGPGLPRPYADREFTNWLNTLNEKE
ncbi:hypothetical protein [Serratia marcescens]|uniref:hypothetical protein n=1 Tax=Serratia marcescens TaxID=615 RepID=UPI0013DAAB06|nr:hypothetical protein [Serratia marcescens]